MLILPFKSPRDVMQVTTLSAHLGLESELVDWYRDATSFAYGHLLIDLSIDYVIVQTVDPSHQRFLSRIG